MMIRSKNLLILVIVLLIGGMFIAVAQHYFDIDPDNLIACPEEALEPCEDEQPAPLPEPEEPDLVACTADAMQCPDGSFVGRTGPDCEFEACPAIVPDQSENVVDSFEDCVAAGNPVMESYPQQCMHEGQHFVEEVEPIEAPFPIIYGTDQGKVDEYRNDCAIQGGSFNECGSACGPDAEVCMAVCALVCEAP